MSVNVGNEISVGIRMPGDGAVGHVRGETRRGSQARALADQKHKDAGSKQITDVVDNANSAITHDEGWAK